MPEFSTGAPKRRKQMLLVLLSGRIKAQCLHRLPTDCLNVSAASSHLFCSSPPGASHDEHSAAEQAASEGLDGPAPRRSDAAASAIGSAEAIGLATDSPDSATVQIGRGANERGNMHTTMLQFV